jgi:hypothetical protein
MLSTASPFELALALALVLVLAPAPGLVLALVQLGLLMVESLCMRLMARKSSGVHCVSSHIACTILRTHERDNHMVFV